ncbi:MAG: glycosyltransferase [Candidatus Latescibacterota bacterium]
MGFFCGDRHTLIMDTIYLVVPYSTESIVSHRARRLTQDLAGEFELSTFYNSKRGWRRWIEIAREIRHSRPMLIYAFKPDKWALFAFLLGRMIGARLMLDTGDLRYALARARGAGIIACWTERLFEVATQRLADAITVRGTEHRLYLESHGYRHVFVIPDGVDPIHSHYRQDPALRRAVVGDGDLVTVGVMGTANWSPKREMCYGWELVEVLSLLRDLPFFGIMIGDGSGLPHLKRRADALGVRDRITFLGRLPYEEIPTYVSLMDIALSTQTNDLVGQVRTTGKLPEYLACGRYILASRVGEAKFVLPEEMLVPYEGAGRDDGYPARLAQRIRDLVQHRERLELGNIGPGIVAERFCYQGLSRKIRCIVEGLLGKKRCLHLSIGSSTPT